VQATGLGERQEEQCPVEATLAVIGGKWKAVLVFYLKRGGAHRFAELRRKTHGISERVLPGSCANWRQTASSGVKSSPKCRRAWSIR
jgi:hypothetical protein